MPSSSTMAAGLLPDAGIDSAQAAVLVDPETRILDAGLLENSWEQDRRNRAEPVELTKLFHSAVPVLKHLNWTVRETGRGFAETILPLSVEASNQHIAHQAAVILIAADYTGGIALGSLLHDVPLVGIHPQKNEYGAYLWGAKADIKWIKPSVDDLVCTARIDKTRHRRIVGRFFQGRRVLETVYIGMRNGGELVAEANVTYWVQDTHALRRHAGEEDKIHILFDHRHKTSAKLIAGLRALEHARQPGERLVEDRFAHQAAGKHGLTLAQRFCLVAPQLRAMVAARTKHLDDMLAAFHRGDRCQVVNIGAGLDTRVLRLSLPSGSKIFDLDLPSMLRRRREFLASYDVSAQSPTVELPIDLRVQDLQQVIRNCGEFDSSWPTFVIWEGGSMYFDRATCEKIMRSVRKVLDNPRSRLWFDFVRTGVVDGSNTIPEVVRFTSAMQCMGEPFINGFSEIASELGTCGLSIDALVTSDIFSPTSDPVFAEYLFCLARRDD